MQQTFQCPHCGFYNNISQQFCGNCGQKLPHNCSYCGASVSYGARFCGNCGSQIIDNTQQSYGWGGTQQQGTWVQIVQWCTSLSTRTYLLILLAGLLIGIGGFVAWQFIPKTDNTPPVISNIAVMSRGKKTVQIVWYTDKASSSQVDYGKTNRYGFRYPPQPKDDPTTGTSAGVLKHIINISNLTPGTNYHYRVKSKDAAGNEVISTGYRTFKTADQLPFMQLDPG